MFPLTSIGWERSTAAVAITIFAAVSIAARPVSGFLADIFGASRVWASAMGLMAAALVILGFADGGSFVPLVLYAAIYGIGIGGGAPLRVPIVREYFGIRNFGTILGLVALFSMCGTVIGAPLTGWVYDVRGVYDPIWFVYAGLLTVAIILVLALPRSAFGKSSSAVG